MSFRDYITKSLDIEKVKSDVAKIEQILSNMQHEFMGHSVDLEYNTTDKDKARIKEIKVVIDKTLVALKKLNY